MHSEFAQQCDALFLTYFLLKNTVIAENDLTFAFPFKCRRGCRTARDQAYFRFH